MENLGYEVYAFQLDPSNPSFSGVFFFPRLRGVWENVPPFIPCLRLSVHSGSAG